VARGVAFFKQAHRRAALPVLVLLATLPPLEAAAQVPPDADWSTLETEHFRVTFPRDLEALGRRAGARAEHAWSELSEAFVEPPSGRIDILLTDHTDVTNGFAQVRPSNRITIVARPPVDDPGLGYFDDWMELVITHELAHIFHLDRAGPLGRFLRRVFGRVPAPWPFFPGNGVPRWTTEGLATWYESYFSEAGRVHGTFHDMIVRTAALEGRFPGLGRASGDSPIWPGGNRAYAFGSLFFEHLLDEYGADRMGAFAEAVAGQIVPYRLDAAASHAFGHTLSEEWDAWRGAVEAEAAAMRAARDARPSPPDPERLTEGERVALYPRVSPDGTRLAYGRADGRSDAQVRVAAPDATGGDELSRTNGVATFDWTPDGAIVLAQLELQDPYRLYDDLYRVEANGATRRLTRGERLGQPSVSPDGRWAVAIQDTSGTNAVVAVDLATGSVRTIVEAVRDVHWAFPRLSPDGRWIAVSRWQPGAHLDVVVIDAESGAPAVQVTDDRAVDVSPAWGPDGRWLVWASDRSGVPNILAVEVDPDAGRVGEARRVTDVLTGASYPSVDPQGRWVHFSGYHAEGWEVERTPFAPDRWPRAEPASDHFAAPPRPVALQDARAPGEIHGYSPFPTLLPTYWEPQFGSGIRTGTVRTPELVIPGREVIGPTVGVHTSGYDLVGRHDYDLFARVSTRTHAGLWDWGAAYDFLGLGNPIFGIAASQFWDDDGVRLAQAEEGAPLDTLFVLQRTRGVSAGMTLVHARWRNAVGLTLSGGLTWEHNELLDNFLDPSRDYALARPETRFRDLRATLSYSSARTFGYQVGPSAGANLVLRARAKKQLQLPDSLVGRLGADASLDEVQGQLRAFHAIGGPGFASHVLALRVSGAAARGPGAHAGTFEVGGASGTRESITGLALFGGRTLFFPVRGYPEAARFGRFAWTASGEYRIPLAVLNGGLGIWPFNADRVLGTLFVDAGNAWGPEEGFTGFQNPRRSTIVSAGAELTAGILAFWSAALDVRVGAAYPFVDGDGATAYVRLGLPF
jgi:Tol biopolymer transport system component